MSEEKHKSRAWAWWAVALLVLYPLSIGPAAWIAYKTGFGEWYYSHGCRPMHELARLSVPGRYAAIYVNLWLPGAPVAYASQNPKTGVALIYKRDGAVFIKNHP